MSASGDDPLLVRIQPETLRRLQELATQYRDLLRLAQVSDGLIAFISRPMQFITGIIFVALLGIYESVVLRIISDISLLLGGTQPFSSPPGETVPGLADFPILTLRVLEGAGGGVASLMLGTLDGLQAVIFEAAQFAGPFAPIVHIVLWAGVLALITIVLYRVGIAVGTALQLDALLALFGRG